MPLKNEKNTKIQAIVYSKDDCRVGLAVDDIVDTVEHSLVDLRPASREGVLASVVIRGRITEILDLEVICSDLMARVLRKQTLETTKV